jgi:hypothetical protein
MFLGVRQQGLSVRFVHEAEYVLLFVRAGRFKNLPPKFHRGWIGGRRALCGVRVESKKERKGGVVGVR